jgi:hypothetical protein
MATAMESLLNLAIVLISATIICGRNGGQLLS